MRAADRDDAGDPPAGADDHVAADLLAEDAVRAADVACALGGHGRRFQAEPGLADRGAASCTTAFSVARRYSSERSKRGSSSSKPDHVGRENAEGLLQQLLAGLVPFEHDDGRGLHGRRVYPPPAPAPRDRKAARLLSF